MGALEDKDEKLFRNEKAKFFYSTVNHVENILMVVQGLVSAIIHIGRNYIVYDEVIRATEGPMDFTFVSVE